MTPGSAFGPHGEGYFRISIGTATDKIVEAVERLRSAPILISKGANHIGQQTVQVQLPGETALLVGVEIKGQASSWSLEDSMAELERLAETAGLQVVGTLQQRVEQAESQDLDRFRKSGGTGGAASDTRAQVIVFDEELSPAQQRELERAVANDDVKVLDRTALDPGHLRTACPHERRRTAGRAGPVRVSPAAPDACLDAPGAASRRRSGARWNRRGGPARPWRDPVGGGSPGDQTAHRPPESANLRRCASIVRATVTDVFEESIPVVALVGYTNAGKSTLLNALSGADIYAADQLFATLDPTTRKIALPGGREVLITDTVGFIQKLPTALVACFSCHS